MKLFRFVAFGKIQGAQELVAWHAASGPSTAAASGLRSAV
jgi:hypothetical protein